LLLREATPQKGMHFLVLRLRKTKRDLVFRVKTKSRKNDPTKKKKKKERGLNPRNFSCKET
jgi:hypothetical protein